MSQTPTTIRGYGGPRDWVMANRGGMSQAEIDAAPVDEWGGGAHSA